MQVSLERTGGFSAIRISTVVDTDSLSPEEATNLRELVRLAGLFEMKQRVKPSRGHPDQYNYRLMVVEDNQTHAIFIQEPDVQPELRQLLDWLVARAKRR